jgi:hypothetical protein
MQKHFGKKDSESSGKRGVFDIISGNSAPSNLCDGILAFSYWDRARQSENTVTVCALSE